MQVRFLSLLAATVAISATAVAFAQNVQSQDDPEPLVPIYMEYEGVKGETSPPPPPPPPPQAPPAERGVQAQPQAGLLLPAVQKMQDPPHETRPQMDGVVVLNSEEGRAAAGGAEAAQDVFVTEAADGQAAHVGSANGGIWKTSDGSANAEEQAQESEPPRERPRRSFSISIGGVTVGTGGVSVAAGDIDGDSSRSSRARPARDGRR